MLPATMSERHHRNCNLCEALCGLTITVERGHVTDIRGDTADPFSRGHICPKGHALKEFYEDPDRLRAPVRRGANGWTEVSWEDALDEAATRLDAIRKTHGRDAIGVYTGNPSVHNHGATLAIPGFLSALRTRNRFDANSQDANPKLLACMLMYGDQFAITVPDVDRTEFLLMLGANPAASNGSVMSLGDVRGRLKGLRARGARFVLVDPRRSETSAWATEHLFVRPGGDAALLLAMLHTIFSEGLARRDDARAAARNHDALDSAVRPFSPERVADAVGVSAPAIRELARGFAGARRAVAYGRVGVCQNAFGTTASALIEALNVVTGNFDRPGGNMFNTPAVDLAGLGRALVGNRYARWRSRVRGLPEFSASLPASVIAEEIETPGAGQIRAFVTIAGNPVSSTPDSARMDRAFASLDFMVSVDCYINETTRHANLILPPVHYFERTHYDVVLSALAVRNVAKHSLPIFPRPANGRTDWEILYDLGMRLGGMRLGPAAVNTAARLAWRAGLAPDPDTVLDLALRTGPYGLSLKRLRESPHGVDLGPLVPAAARCVRTPDRKVDLLPDLVRDDLHRVAAWIDAPRDGGALALIGRRHVRSNNSWLHNCPSLVKGADRTALLMHPEDARRLAIPDGAAVRVRSAVGAVDATAALSDEVMPGVVSLPHGFGQSAVRDTLRVAGAIAAPNANVLNDTSFLDPISGTAALNGITVTVTVRSDAEAHRTHDPGAA